MKKIILMLIIIISIAITVVGLGWLLEYLDEKG
jgi:hypothetical protein